MGGRLHWRIFKSYIRSFTRGTAFQSSLFYSLQKGRFLLVVQHFNAKAWVFKAAVPPLEIRDLDLQVSGEQCVLFWAACWCFPKWVDSDGTFITTCNAGFLTARHTLASQNSKRSASPEVWISGCLPCMFLSSSGSPRSVTLHCTECLAPKFLACVSHLGRAGFVAHLWGQWLPYAFNSPVLVPSAPGVRCLQSFWKLSLRAL